MRLILLLSVLLTTLTTPISTKSVPYRNEAVEELERAFDEYISTGIRPSYFEEALSKNQLPHLFRKIEAGQLDELKEITCSVCETVAEFLITERRHNVSSETLADEATVICALLDVESERVCSGTINLNVDVFVYMIDNNPEIDGHRVCSVIIPTCAAENDFDWNVVIPEGSTVEKQIPDGSSTFNVLHISDFHYDHNYVAGKSNQCGEPLCCQYDNEDGDQAAGTACGYWTDYFSADSPEVLVDEVFRQVQSHDFEYAYYTGDIVSHRVWQTSKENNTKAIQLVFEKFRSNLKVPVFPVLGNHEPHPLNVWFSRSEEQPEFSTRWLFELIAEEWSDWLDDEAKETLLEGGFYTISPRKGFRIIALNSNVAYVSNWWLIDDDVDPYGQLDWLAKTLKRAEASNEKVHIIQHIPSGNAAAFTIWSREYNKIVNRFANTITGQFTGHTHTDEFYVFYNNSNPSQAINLAWNGASVVPYTLSNPSYKLYNVDNDTLDVLDVEEWTFDLLDANQNPEKTPEWYQLYSFKNAYSVESLEPQNIADLAVWMTKNHTLIHEYNRFKFRNSPVRGDCDENCQKSCLCTIVTSNSNDQSQCENIKQIYDDNK